MMKATRNTLALATAWATGASSSVFYVSSGGCDGTDKGCIDNATEEAFMQAVSLGPDRRMTHLPALATDTGGMPAWMTISGKCLFATVADKSKIFSYNVNEDSGALTGPVSDVASGGVNPVYAAAMSGGKILLVANYHGPDDTNTSTGAAATTFAISDDCSLRLTETIPHAGHSVNPQRQGGAHVHSFVEGPAGSGIAYACDLGMDIIFSYSVNETGMTEIQRTATEPGSGPRHLVQHPKLPFIYVVSEMGMTVMVYKEIKFMDGKHWTGELELVQTVSLVQKGQSGEGSKASEIAMTPDGSTIYATNRGKLNTVTVLQVQPDGKLQQKQVVDAPAFPRGMTMMGDHTLLVAGQSHGEVVAYAVGEGGELALSHNITIGKNFHPAAFAVLPDELALKPQFV